MKWPSYIKFDVFRALAMKIKVFLGYDTVEAQKATDVTKELAATIFWICEVQKECFRPA